MIKYFKTILKLLCHFFHCIINAGSQLELQDFSLCLFMTIYDPFLTLFQCNFLFYVKNLYFIRQALCFTLACKCKYKYILQTFWLYFKCYHGLYWLFTVLFKI